MKHEVIVPNVGESITEVFIGEWKKKSGDHVEKEDVLVDLETQKTSFELHAEVSGRIEVLQPDPETRVRPGDVIAVIEAGVGDSPKAASSKSGTSAPPPSPSAAPKSPAPANPSAARLMAEQGVDANQVSGSGRGGRILKEDVIDLAKEREKKEKKSAPLPATSSAPTSPSESGVVDYPVDESRGERKEPASRIRITIAQNLLKAQRSAAILTTFNEVDMSAVMDFRKKYKDVFKEKHGVGLGMVGFFARAAVRALKKYPLVNATFTGKEIIYRDFVDLGVAVSTDHGLVVPVMRDVDRMSLADFEKSLATLSEKARLKKLSIPEMSGGTFTISNGGVFGSLLSTPILNPPQSAILGLHKIQERPIVVKGEIAIRPMMYLALSYDHRIIDGKEAVGFLVTLKEGIEDLFHILSEEDL